MSWPKPHFKLKVFTINFSCNYGFRKSIFVLQNNYFKEKTSCKNLNLPKISVLIHNG